jgi:hypothetical protein
VPVKGPGGAAGTANLGPFSTVPSVVKNTVIANPLGGGPNCSGAPPKKGKCVKKKRKGK